MVFCPDILLIKFWAPLIAEVQVQTFLTTQSFDLEIISFNDPIFPLQSLGTLVHYFHPLLH